MFATVTFRVSINVANVLPNNTALKFQTLATFGFGGSFFPVTFS